MTLLRNPIARWVSYVRFFRKLVPDRVPGGIQNGVGEIGQVLGGFRNIGKVQDIAQQNPKELPAAEKRQIDGAGNTVGGQ